MDSAERTHFTEPGRRRSQFRFGLADLSIWVLGAGLFIAAVRTARGVWPGRTPDPDRLYGLWACGLAIFLALGLATGASRSRRADPAESRFSVVWRLLASLVLAGFAVEESRRLATLKVPVGSAALELLPVCGAIGMVGLMAGLSTVRGPSRRRSSWDWLSPVLAVIAGIVMTYILGYGIPYLVLLAIEAVWHAMHHPDLERLSRPDVATRLRRADLQVTVAMLIGITSATWLGHDLRASIGRHERVRTWVFRIMAVVGPAGCLGWLLLRTIPLVHECFLEGLFWITLGPTEAGSIVLGFGGLAAGIAARGGTRAPTDDPEIDAGPINTPQRSRFHRVLKAALAVALMLLVFDAIQAIRFPGSQRFSLIEHLRVLGSIPEEFLADLFAFLLGRPTSLLLAASLSWVSWRVAVLLTVREDRIRAPLDVAGSDRKSFLVFIMRWFALWMLFLAALPAFFVASLGVSDWVVRGSGF